jgi:histidine triad (HIT) family protein
MEESAMSEGCLFCRIASGELQAAVVAEDEMCMAFRDIAPKAPVHCLVIPRKHYVSLNDVDDFTLLGRLMVMAAQVARAEGIADTGYRVVANTNSDGGQTVFHLHLHVLGGRKLTLSPG